MKSIADSIVLIETLWNVKMEASSFLWIWTQVLIETLWNVKKTVKLGSKGTSVVLIETLWNVKKWNY